MDVELRHIHKWFGKNHANDDISLTIPSGTIQGVLGENGAGKSTLMKVLSGFIHAEGGQVVLDGKPVVISNPAQALKFGIGMLHQDPLDFPPMKVIDNFIIGAPVGFFPNQKKIIKEFNDLQRQFEFEIDPESYVDSLTVGERQQLEIIRLLWMGARVLILDEPTTGISALQKEKLFATLVKLAGQGMTVIFVSHKLEEVEGLCHRVAVLSRGKLVGEVHPPYTTEVLVQLMFGKEVAKETRDDSRKPDCYLKLDDISVEDFRLRIKNVNLTVNCGEIIGLAGMEGSGQRQFLRMLAGLIRPVNGKIVIDSTNMAGKSYHQYKQSGIAYVPAARLEEGLVPGLTLSEHFVLSEPQSGFFINRDKAQALAKKRIEEFSIRGQPTSPIESLSGGNQQRALLALMRDPLRLLLLEHPTRGLDIESAIWIWHKLKERCHQGTSIVFISSDLDEIIHYSHRILVFFGGKVSQPLEAKRTSIDQLGLLIGGKGW